MDLEDVKSLSLNAVTHEDTLHLCNIGWEK